MNKAHLRILALSLTAVGLSLFLYKALVLHFPLTPQSEADIWEVEAKIIFQARNEPVKLSLFIPYKNPRYAILNDAFVSRGYGLSTSTDGLNRRAVWSIRKARGEQILFYRAEARRAEFRRSSQPAKNPEVMPPTWEGARLGAAEALLDKIRRKSADPDSLVAQLLQELNKQPPDHDVAILLGKRASEAAKMKVAVGVLALAQLPARSVHGIRLREMRERAPIIHWLEVFHQKQWRPYNPATAGAGLPEDYLSWWRGPYPLMSLEGGNQKHLTISVSRVQEAGVRDAIVRGELKNPLLLKFSLFSLPVHSQQIYRILLMVPLGAVLLVIFRNVIGLSTFGTFMPVLIALAFRETHLVAGLVLFSIIVGFGLIIRFYLNQLKLLLVPRLAAVLIVVVLLMAFLSLMSHLLGIQRGLSVALFPMVILTMTIERMTIVWEERGPGEAIKQGLGSLLAAALTYLVINNQAVQHLLFVFPELLLVLLAATLLLGRYSGYRLTELFRFRHLSREFK